MAYRDKLRRLVADYHAGRVRQDRIVLSVRGWLNHVRYGDTWGLRGAMLQEVRL